MIDWNHFPMKLLNSMSTLRHMNNSSTEIFSYFNGNRQWINIVVMIYVCLSRLRNDIVKYFNLLIHNLIGEIYHNRRKKDLLSPYLSILLSIWLNILITWLIRKLLWRIWLLWGCFWNRLSALWFQKIIYRFLALKLFLFNVSLRITFGMGLEIHTRFSG